MSDLSYEKLLDCLFDGIYYVDINKKITFWNKGAERITGYYKSEVMGSCCSDNILRHIDDNKKELCVVGCPLSQTLADGNYRESDVYLHHKLGHRVPVSVRISPVHDDSGKVIGAIEVFTDNSNSIQILKDMENLKKEVYLDTLTTIGNRKYGELSLNTRIQEWHAHSIPFGVVFLDIDHFKQINDRHGHKTGDDILGMVGMTLSSSLRKHDIPVRWGGEEFVLLLPNVNQKMLGLIAERIRLVIEHSFIMIGKEKLSVTASIGATLAALNDTADTIINRADALMYKSKACGRNVVTLDSGCHEILDS